MNERQQHIAVGLTAVFAIVGLAFMMLLFGYVPGWIRGGYDVTVELPNAAGLHQDGVVTFRGIEVGKVQRVTLKEPPEVGVVALLSIRHRYKLPANVTAVLEGSVFGTNAQLALRADGWPTGDGPPRTLPTDGSAVIQGTSASATQTIANLSDQLDRLSDEWVKVGQNVNALLEPRDPDAVNNGDAIANASTVLVRLDQRLAELEQVMAGVNRYVNDDTLWQDVRQTAASAREATGDARDLARELRTQVPQDIAALRARYIALADDLSVAVASLNQTLDATRQPDGTLGKMLVDPALYNNMNDSFIRLQGAIDEMRLLMEKWKDEGLPVQF